MAHVGAKNKTVRLGTRKDTVTRAPLVHIRDVANAGTYAVLAPIAWSLPGNQLPRAAQAIARLLSAAAPSGGRHQAYRKTVLGERLDASRAAAVQAEILADVTLERLYPLRCHRPGGWQPACRVAGGEHIEAALAGGRGALLWVMPVRYSDLISKIALHRAGYEVSHLSRFNHPGSNTHLGRALVNPVRPSRGATSPNAS